MPLPPAPIFTPVPLPHSRTPTYTGYAYTPAPSPSPSSLEAWRNKPQRIQAWSHTLPPPLQGNSMSWGKGVGAGSAEWSGTTNTSKGRSKRNEDEVEEEDKGTEPTTYRKGRVHREDRAGEVIKEQIKMGSQASSVGRNVRGMGSGSGSQVNLAVPPEKIPPNLGERMGPGSRSRINLAVPTQSLDVPPKPLELGARGGKKLGLQPSAKHTREIRPIASRSNSQVNLAVPPGTRAPPTPALALPQHPLPAMPPVLFSGRQSKRPSLKPLGSEISVESARSVRDAYIESALHLPIDILSAKEPNPAISTKASMGVNKSKSNARAKAITNAKKPFDDTARKVRSGAEAVERVTEDKVGKGVKGVSRSRTSAAALGLAKSGTVERGHDTVPASSKPKAGIPLEPVKTWPRSTSKLARLEAEMYTPHNPYLDLPTPPARQASLVPPVPEHQLLAPIPSSSIVTAAPHSRVRTHQAGPQSGYHPPRQPTLAQRQPTPALRPALSRSASSVDILGRKQDTSCPSLQARFEPNMYPLPASGTRTNTELSPVRPNRGMHVSTAQSLSSEYTARSLGSATSHKARMPIVIDLDPSLTSGSSRNSPHTAVHASPPSTPPPQLDIIGSPSGNSPPAEGDRIAFEIPSGTRARLRVSLAWLRDAKSPSKRWKDRVYISGNKRTGVNEDSTPPPLPMKDNKWSYKGNRHSEQGFRPTSPRYEAAPYPSGSQAEYRNRSRPPSPRSPERYSPQPRLMERERDRVRFSPEPPLNIARSPLAWTQSANPYLTVPGLPGLPGPFVPARPPLPFQAYPQPHPNAWAAMSLPNVYNPSAPRTQAPPSPRPSIDPPSDTSPPRMDHPLPNIYRPSDYPAPMSMSYPQASANRQYGYGGPNTNAQNGYGNTNTLPWSGRSTMWQRMFRPSNREGRPEWDQTMRGKEGLISSWRRNIQPGKGTTVVANGFRQEGKRLPEQGYDVRGERPGWFSLGKFGQRPRRDDQNMRNHPETPYHIPSPRFERKTSQRRGIWPFTINRQNRSYPPIIRTAPATHVQSQRIPSPAFNSKEQAKEERRAQRKERRDRRNLGPRPRDIQTLHPDDSVTRAAGAMSRPALDERVRSRTMVKDWVERVSKPARDRRGREGKQSENGREGSSWKKRLNLRSQGARDGGKLRRSGRRIRHKERARVGANGVTRYYDA